MPRSCAVLTWFGLALAASCGDPRPVPHEPAVRAGAVVDTQAVSRELQSAKTRWSDALLSRDIGRMVAVYDPRAALYRSGMPPLHGRVEIARRMKSLLDSGTFTLAEARTEDVVASGDLAIEFGWRSATVVVRGNHEPTNTRVQHLLVWRRGEDGAYRIIRDIELPGGGTR